MEVTVYDHRKTLEKSSETRYGIGFLITSAWLSLSVQLKIILICNVSREDSLGRNVSQIAVVNPDILLRGEEE